MMPQGSFKPRTHCVAKPAQSVLQSNTTHRERAVARVAATAVRDFFCTWIPGQTPKLGGRVTRLCAAALSRKPHQRIVQPPATRPIYQRIALDGDGARDAAPE